MKLTLVLRDKKNALKLSTKTIESFIERIKSDTKDRTVGYLKEEVGISLLKPVSLPVFGRKLTNLPGLQKRVTKYNTEYLVKRKK